jgi:hypothetical protein
VIPVRYELYLYVPYGSHSKQRNVFPVRYELYLMFRMVLTINSDCFPNQL